MSIFSFEFLPQSCKEVIEDTEAQLAPDHTIRKQQWWILNPELRSFPRYAEWYGQRGGECGMGWPEQLDNALDNTTLCNLWFEVILRKWFTQCCNASSILCTSGSWHLEAWGTSSAAICCGAHWLDVWCSHGVWSLGILLSVHKSTERVSLTR